LSKEKLGLVNYSFCFAKTDGMTKEKGQGRETPIQMHPHALVYWKNKN
jgi:hypothetical protein